MNLNNQFHKNSLDCWCEYCKDEIFDTEKFIRIGDTNIVYHLFCFKQSNTYNDEDDDGIRDEDEQSYID